MSVDPDIHASDLTGAFPITGHDDTAQRTPAQHLAVAAARLRDLAQHTSVGPWYADGGDGVYAHGAPGQGCPPVFTDGRTPYADIQWIAALGPTIAAPLAALLDDAAAAATAGNYPGFYHHALAIARSINGEPA